MSTKQEEAHVPSVFDEAPPPPTNESSVAPDTNALPEPEAATATSIADVDPAVVVANPVAHVVEEKADTEEIDAMNLMMAIPPLSPTQPVPQVPAPNAQAVAAAAAAAAAAVMDPLPPPEGVEPPQAPPAVVEAQPPAPPPVVVDPTPHPPCSLNFEDPLPFTLKPMAPMLHRLKHAHLTDRPASEPFPATYQPRVRDICNGRGKSHWNLPGNKAFRKYVQVRVYDYMQVESKVDKTKYVMHCVHELRTLGFQFVRENTAGRWYELGDAIARNKVGHSLRDQVAALRKLDGPKRKRASATLVSNASANTNTTDTKVEDATGPNKRPATAAAVEASTTATAAATAAVAAAAAAAADLLPPSAVTTAAEAVAAVKTEEAEEPTTPSTEAVVAMDTADAAAAAAAADATVPTLADM